MRLVVLVAVALVGGMGVAHACSDRAARMQTAVQADIRTRNVAAAVGERLIQELREAAAHCSAGRAAQGEAIIRRINGTYGYR